MGKLSLKKLKFHEDMSEETPCFSADLYEDGILVAYVKNSGRGGCNDIYAVEGKSYKDIAHLTDLDTDCDIMQLAEDMNFAKINQTKGFVLKKFDVKKGSTYYTSKFPKPISKLKKVRNYTSWLEIELEQYKEKGFEVLNTNL